MIIIIIIILIIYPSKILKNAHRHLKNIQHHEMTFCVILKTFLSLGPLSPHPKGLPMLLAQKDTLCEENECQVFL